LTFKELEKKLAKLVDNIGNRSQMQDVADEATKIVKTRTKQGKGVDKNGGSTQKLRQLKTSTIKKRSQLKRAGKLSDETTPSKSNLTQKGEMINSVQGQGQKNLATVSLKGRKNQSKAEHQADVGRKFMNLAKKEISDLANIIEDDIKKDIKKQGL